MMRLVVAEPGDYVLFTLVSILVLISFAPILLSTSSAPAFERTNPKSLRQLYMLALLGYVGMFLLGGVFASQFGMTAIFGSVILQLVQISSFVAAFYFCATVLQHPIAWFSDRMDQHLLIVLVSVLETVAAVFLNNCLV